MDITQAYPGKHFKAADLGGETITLQVAAVVIESIGDDGNKPVMKFYGVDQDLVLNQTNANTLVEAWGKQTESWIGQTVQLYPTQVQFGSKMVDAVRVKAAQQGAPGVAPAAPAQGVVPQQQPVQQPVLQQTVQQPVQSAPTAAPQGYPTAPGQVYNPLG